MAVRKQDIGPSEYLYGFHDAEDEYVFKSQRGLSADVVRSISAMKGEPEWMLRLRLRALELFYRKPMPSFGADLSGIDFDNIYYYVKPSESRARDWDEVPEAIKKTFDRLGIPEAERKFLAGVSAQYESEVVYHNVNEELEKLGVLFCDMDTAVKKYPEIVQKYLATIIPVADNKFAALNSAVWSGGSF